MEALTTISSKYQIMIPREVREQFNLKPGQKVLFIPYKNSIPACDCPVHQRRARDFQGDENR